MFLIRKLFVISLLLLTALLHAQSSTGVITDIVVTGNKQVTVPAILAAMRTKKGQPYNQAQLDFDKQTLEDMGFFEAVDVRAKVDATNGWIINVDVHEYPVVKEIRVVGNTAVSTADILKVINLQTGQVFNNKSIKPSSDAITALYTKKGFFAQIDAFGPLKESPNTVNISIIELTVGNVQVKGADRTRPSVMHHLIRTRPGDPYNVRKWESDLKRIYGTQWFESVKPSEDERRELGKVDLTVEVKEAKTGTVGVGLQLDPSSRLAGFMRVSDSNFRGTGQSVGVNYLQSTTGGGPSVDLNYGNPYIDRHDTSMSISLYSHLIYRFAGSGFGAVSNPTNNNAYNERRTGGTLGFGREIRPQVFANINGRFEHIKTNNLDTTVSDSFIQQDGDVGVLTFAVVRNRRDVDLDPSRGDWLRISVDPGFSRITEVGGANPDNSILGSNAFLKQNFELRKYWSPGQPARTTRDLEAPRRVIALRVRYGGISGKVPFFEQYFAGGSETIRGYAEDRYWGRQNLLTTLEYRHPVQKSFNVIGFVDYGGAWGGYGSVNSYTQSENISLHVGYGVGLSFKTPLGPIRLDLGFDDHGKSRTHFLIGTSF